jgi:hypothetical protein
METKDEKERVEWKVNRKWEGWERREAKVDLSFENVAADRMQAVINIPY